MIMTDHSYLKELESEAIYILREVASHFKNPVLLFSGGKDSIVMSYLAKKAFYPSPIPFRFLHVDTGHNFPETIAFRDQWCKDLGVELLTGEVQEWIDQGLLIEETGPSATRNKLQTTVLLDSLENYNVDCAMGGGRRDEEKARAKERFFSHRNDFGQWDPKNQRPELWHLFNTNHATGEHFRTFPLSNWTELDIWRYIKEESIDLPSLYLSHERECIIRD